MIHNSAWEEIKELKTKKEVCEKIIDLYCKREGKKENEITGEDLFKSSLLCVALEHLNKIPESYEEYARSRGGVLTIDTNNTSDNFFGHVYSLREFLETLN